MRIDVLYLEGCPHVGATMELLDRVLRANGLHCSILETKVGDPEEALSVRFLGSPTVRTNGIDVEPSARQRTDFGLMCRTYDGNGGVPSEGLIQAAISNAAADS